MPHATKINIAIAQYSPKMGDFEGNFATIAQLYKLATGANCDLVIFPELAVSGYWPEDLCNNEEFVRQEQHYLQQTQELATNAAIVIGHLHQQEERIFNAASVFQNQQLLGRNLKRNLPNYNVFDEKRNFSPGNDLTSIELKLSQGQTLKIGLLICEDAWFPEASEALASQGAELFIVINGSPYEIGKATMRLEVMAPHCQKHNLPLIYCNRFGAQDELVFDGGSFALNNTGNLDIPPQQFFEGLICCELESGTLQLSQAIAISSPFTGATVKSCNSLDIAPHVCLNSSNRGYQSLEHLLAEVYSALVAGTKEYLTSCGKVFIGLSGGIDSALVAQIACDALGANRVHGILMPSRFSSESSITDAKELADNLGIATSTLSIEPIFSATLETLNFSTGFDIAEENLQARIRGMILMAHANKHHGMVLTTGNKSEYACGYTTLYGDMCGAYAPLKDLYKTQVYALCKWRNAVAEKNLIPEKIITKAPSAELRPNQLDQDSLPPYDVLDDILYHIIELNDEASAASRYDAELISKVKKLLRSSEFKRRQAAIGPKINHNNFGKGWRYPITSCFY